MRRMLDHIQFKKNNNNKNRELEHMSAQCRQPYQFIICGLETDSTHDASKVGVWYCPVTFDIETGEGLLEVINHSCAVCSRLWNTYVQSDNKNNSADDLWRLSCVLRSTKPFRGFVSINTVTLQLWIITVLYSPWWYQSFRCGERMRITLWIWQDGFDQFRI